MRRPPVYTSVRFCGASESVSVSTARTPAGRVVAEAVPDLTPVPHSRQSAQSVPSVVTPSERKQGGGTPAVNDADNFRKGGTYDGEQVD